MRPRTMLLRASWFLVPCVALATADGPDRFDVTNVRRDDVLNMRERPGADAAIVAKIPPTAKGLDNLGCVPVGPGKSASESRQQFWCKVHYRGHVGWVRSSYLAEATAD